MMEILQSDQENTPDRILRLFLEVDGLGLAKAGFLGQLATAHTGLGCLDSNNLIWHSIDKSVNLYNKKQNQIGF